MKFTTPILIHAVGSVVLPTFRENQERYLELQANLWVDSGEATMKRKLKDVSVSVIMAHL